MNESIFYQIQFIKSLIFMFWFITDLTHLNQYKGKEVKAYVNVK